LKALRKTIVYLFAFTLLLIVGAVASLFLFKDRIIQQFIREANKNLGTPISIGKIDVSALDDFPNLAIVCTDVYIEDSHTGKYPLLTAKKVSFTLNPVDVWQGRYIVQGLRIEDSETNLRIDKDGENNYTIVRYTDDSVNAGGVSFNLQNVRLLKSTVNYHDQSVIQHHAFFSNDLTATIIASDNQYHIKTKGDITIRQIGVGKSVFFKDKAFDVSADLDYNDEEKSMLFKPTTMTIGGDAFDVSGSYLFKDKNLMDLHVVGKETDLQSLLELFPEDIHRRFEKYESKGEVYFDARLKGEISRRKDPFLTVAFGFRNVTLVHPGSKSNLEEVHLQGTFSTPSLSKYSQAALSLENISASLNGTPFKGNFNLRNFDDPFVTMDFEGEQRAEDILNFYPVNGIHELKGMVKAKVSMSGQIALLKNRTTAQQVRTEGTVELKDMDMTIGKRNLHFEGLNGTLQFNNNDLAMSDLRGKFERSDFRLNGFFKNIVTYIIFDNQPIGIEADLSSRFLDVDRLFEIGFSESEKGPYAFSISPAVNLNFNCSIDSLNFKRFHAIDVKGDLLVKGQVAVSRSIKLKAMGGSIDLSGIVDAKNPKAIDLITSATLQGIYVDSLFYVFDNFRQDFIAYNHLKGQADAFINLEATLQEGLRIFPETLIADVNTTIRKGEINNFEPLRKLNKYLDDDGLNKLRFAELKNDIHIENKTVYIPQMDIRSNVTTLMLSGTHSFDQNIDYRVVAPLRNKKKIDPDEAFGAVEDDLQGRSKVYLKITGTTDNYKVAYDQVAVRKKIGNDLKKEVQELKDAFRLKGKKKKKELELQKDDYFDFDTDH